MTIEVSPAELYALAGRLQATADQVAGVPARLDGTSGTGDLAPALSTFTAEVGAAAALLGGELDWLGSTVAGVADSWTGLDSGLLAPRGQATRR